MPRFVVLAAALIVAGGGAAAVATPVVVNVAAFGADPAGRVDSAPALAAALRFDVCDVSVVNAKSVGGFTFSGNTIHRPDGPSAPPHTSPLFVFHGSTGIQITHNRYDKGLNTSVVQD
jgi:hypothetical protein